MKIATCLILLVFQFGCKKQSDDIEQSPSDDGSYAPNGFTGIASSRWSLASFPLKLHISNSFGADESQAIRDAANAWSEVVEHKMDFLDANYSTEEKGVSDLAFYDDSTIGIYKLSNWPEELSPNALGLAQIFGYRRNAGRASEYIEIVHGDIFVNAQSFHFTLDDSWGYSLQSLALHELGHLLGLSHDVSSEKDTVMYPYLSRYVKHHSPTSRDAKTIAAAYGLEAGGIQNIEPSDFEREESEKIVIKFEINGGAMENCRSFRVSNPQEAF